MSSFNKRLITMGILAAIAIAAFLVVQFVELGGKEEDEEAEALPEQPEVLFPAAVVDVVESLYVTSNETGEVFSAALQDDASWTILEAVEGSDTGLGVDEERLLRAVYSLPTLTPTRVLSDIEVLATYGLINPAYTIRFTTSGGGEYTLDVGSPNPGETAYYVRLPGDSSTVYLISKFSLDPIIEFVEQPPYLQPTEEEGEVESSRSTGDGAGTGS